MGRETEGYAQYASFFVAGAGAGMGGVALGDVTNKQTDKQTDEETQKDRRTNRQTGREGGDLGYTEHRFHRKERVSERGETFKESAIGRKERGRRVKIKCTNF
jgi:hypothetical protein